MKGSKIGLGSIALLLIVAAVLVWTGCGSSSSSGGSSAMLSGLEPFVGGAKLLETKDGTETTVNGAIQDRDWTYVFQVEASDPRASGTLEIKFNADAQQSMNARFWGTCTLTNSKGSWVCDGWNGAMTGTPQHQFTFAPYKGTGAYDGLALYIQWHMVETSAEMLPPSAPGGTAVSGWIQKAK
jgi:hypothetical protein